MAEANVQESSLHPNELLPLYASGGLAPDLLQSVSSHLASCIACREELSEWTAISAAVREDEVEAPDPDRAWEKLQARVKADSGQERAAARGRRRASDLFRPFPALGWGLAAAQLAVIVGLVVYIASGPRGEIPWVPLGGGMEAPAKGARLQVVFQEEATAEEIADLLGSAAGQIVQGPSVQGVYVVAIPDRAEVAVESAVALFQSRPDLVKWVQQFM